MGCSGLVLLSLSSSCPTSNTAIVVRMGAWDEKYTYPDGDTIPPQSEMIEMGLPDYEASPELDAWSYYRNIF